MAAKDFLTETADLLGLSKDEINTPPTMIKRESESLDDFEHLGHDNSPIKDIKSGFDNVLNEESQARDIEGVINKGVESAANTVSKLTDDFLFDPLQKLHQEQAKMDSNLLDMGEYFPDRKEADAKVDKFLSDMSSFGQVEEEKKDDVKATTLNFMDMERELEKQVEKSDDILEHYSDSDPEDEFKHAESDEIRKDPPQFSSKSESFKDVNEFMAKELKEETPILKEQPPKPAVETAPFRETPKEQEESPKETAQEIKIEEPVIKPKEEVKIEEPKVEKIQPAKNLIEAEAMFCKMGLDAWFNPERLNPKVESLIYWRDPKTSGQIFGAVLVILLSLKFFSLISVIAYLSLLGLAATISFRIYKNIVQAVQKTGDGHPFKEYLEIDVSLPQNKVEDVTKVAVAHINAAVVELRRLFLVEDLVDSIKFAVLLWCFTYVGAWFNGITLIILAWVALFSLPKVYETNKTQIDANLDIVKSRLADITSKVKAAVPIGKKSEEKKE